MNVTLIQIWRHPIKALGRERVAQAHLAPGDGLPGDRVWAIAHDAAKAKKGAWSPCVNFIRAASSPALMAVTATLNEADETVTLRHPERPEITLHPEREADRLVDWATPLVAKGRPAPARVIRADRTMTDSRKPSLSIANHATHKAVEAQIGRSLSRHRWRANLWIDGLPAWEEFDWVDHEVTIGTARLRIVGRTTRCRATESNPETGQRDTETLAALRNGWAHQDFAIKAEVIAPGDIFEGCELHL